MLLEKAVEQVYKGRERMILLGLTGRTGSGCTKVAEILQTENFNDLDLVESKTREYKDADERKYKVIKDYMAVEKRWKKFDVIEISSIILASALELGEDKFVEYLENITVENQTKSISIGEKQEVIKAIREISYMFENAQKYPLSINLEDESNKKLDWDGYYEFYTKTIKIYKNSFKNILEDYTCFEVKRSRLKGKKQNRYHLYTFLMQQMGNNLRSSGNPYDDGFSEENFRKFFKRIDNLIHVINKAKEHEEDKSVRICIDAIRNPYEALYFKDKYKSFHLMAISTDDEDRRGRLKYLNNEELENLDSVEYARKSKKPEEVFYHQNIQGCLEVADIHVYNKDVDNGKFYRLTEQLIKYISLMLHPGLVTPTHLERCMQLAYNAKYNSGCLSRQVGAVVTRDDFSIQSIGWNDVPKGQVSCNLRDISSFCANKDKESFSKFEIEDPKFNSVMEKLDTEMVNKACGRCKSYCFKDIYNGINDEKNQVYTRALHAEENAFLQISKYGGTKVSDGYLFTTASPCELCAKKAYQLGIKHIYYIDPYPGISQKHILTFGEKNNPEMRLFYGAIGNAYLDFYETRIPAKDELEMLTDISVKQIAKGKKVNNSLKYEDVTYKNVSVELKFVGSRSVIESSRMVEFKLNNNIDVIPKTIVWTGSSYEGTKLIKDESDKGIELEDQNISMPYGYKIILDKDLIGKEYIKYKTTTYAKDEKRVMEPYLAHMVKNKTQKLCISLSVPYEGIVKNVKSVVYADLTMETKVSEECLEEVKSDTDSGIHYKFSPENVNVNYTYAIEWEFE